MIIKSKKSKSHLILGSLFLLIGFILFSYKHIFKKVNDVQEQIKINNFFDNHIPIDNSIDIDDSQNIENVSSSDYNDYIAVLEIPSISLKKGIFSKDNINNYVDKNIQILNDSDMPDLENGNLILAGHSGNSLVSYFTDLDRVKKDDIVNVYYNNIKYSYKIVNIYIQNKNGMIKIYRDKNISTITLTTCSEINNYEQLVLIGNLVFKENY